MRLTIEVDPTRDVGVVQLELPALEVATADIPPKFWEAVNKVSNPHSSISEKLFGFFVVARAIESRQKDNLK